MLVEEERTGVIEFAVGLTEAQHLLWTIVGMSLILEGGDKSGLDTCSPILSVIANLGEDWRDQIGEVSEARLVGLLIAYGEVDQEL